MAERTEHLESLTDLAGIVLTHTDLDEALVAICQIAARSVPGAEAASLTIERVGVPAATASDDWGKALDEMQYEQHEGPCFDAMRSGNAFRVGDLASDPRWPSYGPRAAAAGARSVLSLPASSDGRVVAALNIYSREPEKFDAEAASIGQIVAAHAGLASQVSVAFQAHRELADQMREAMTSRAVIEQAKGMIMLRDRCDPDAAFDTLVSASQKSNTKLRHVAQMVVNWGMEEREDGAKVLEELAEPGSTARLEVSRES